MKKQPKKKSAKSARKHEPVTISVHGEGVHIDIDMRLDGAQDAARAFGEVCETIAARFFGASSVHVPQAMPVGPEPFIHSGPPPFANMPTISFSEGVIAMAPRIKDDEIERGIAALVAERDRRSAIREATAS